LRRLVRLCRQCASEFAARADAELGVSANTNANVIAIAERAAALITR
jgi:hypothetical protein